MKHLSEEDWIEHYYGENPYPQAVQEHLAQCAECAAMGRELARDLGELHLGEGDPERDSSYGEGVWQTLRSSLEPYPRQELRTFWRWWPVRWNLRAGLGFASAAVVLAAIAAAAFYSGRLWEKKQSPRIAAVSGSQRGQRVILFVVSDHLDRSQRLLAELNDPDEAASDRRLQATARELLTENRLYRQSSAHSSSPNETKDPVQAEDSSLETILDDLEPVLVELANQPDDLDRAKIIQLRKELNTSGLLFEIRVLRSKAREEQPNGSLDEGTI